MTDIDKKTFDLRSAVAGISYPEREVRFYLDRDAALEVGQWSTEAQKWANLKRPEKFDDAEKKMYAAIEKFKASEYTAVVRDIPRDLKKSILKKVAAEIPEKPDETTADGVIRGFDVTDAERNLRWEAQVVRVINPEGAVHENPDAETIKYLRDFGAEPSVAAIQAQIDEFDAAAGYEIAARNVDFS